MSGFADDPWGAHQLRQAQGIQAAIVRRIRANTATDVARPIPPNAMRVGPGTDAVVFPICYGDGHDI